MDLSSVVAGRIARGSAVATAMLFLLGVQAPAAAATGIPAAATRYVDCDALTAQAANGVARNAAAARAAVRAGYLRPAVDTGAYRRNAALDANGNGVACEQEPGPRAVEVRWSEPGWCPDRRPLDDLQAGYDPGNPRPTLVEVARRRYPPAVSAIGAQSDDALRTWLRQGDGGPADFTQLLQAFPTVTHEGGHLLDLNLRTSPFRHAYRISDDSDLIEAAEVQAYPRSAILRLHPDPAKDPYAAVYLIGPGGGQDVEMLVEEFVQYVHSLASAACVVDVPRNVRMGYRDGALTMMWWIELYLKYGREQDPQGYAAIRSNADLVRVILRTWDRAEYWLARTRGSRLGDADAALAQRVYQPANLDEVRRLRAIADGS